MAIYSSQPSSSLETHEGFVDGYHGQGSYVGCPLLHDYEQGAKKKVVGKDGEEGGGATFVRTCFNGLNALSGFSVRLLASLGWLSYEILRYKVLDFQAEGVNHIVFPYYVNYAHTISLSLGVGILSIPYALSEGGWLSLMFLLLLAATCCFTGLLLQRCMNAGSQIDSYPDIGELAFGYPGRIMVSFFMNLELYLVAIGFLILEGDNLDKLFPNTNLELGQVRIEGKQLFVLVSALMILPTTWLRSLGSLAFVSVGGVLASIILVGSVLWVGAFDHVGFQERGQVVNFTGLPTALGLYAFCYCGHAVFPSLCTSMKDRTKFPKVLLVCFFLCTLNYGSMAVFGYLMYGGHLKSQITLNLPVKNTSTKIAIYTTLINPIAKYALLVTPVATTVEQYLFSSNRRSTSLLTRTLLVTSTVVIALAVPLFGYLMALIGSFLSVIVSLLLPCMCYLKIFGAAEMSRLELMIIIGILVMSILIGVLGTYSSLKQIALNI